MSSRKRNKRSRAKARSASRGGAAAKTRRILSEAAGVVALALALLCFVALLTRDPSDPLFALTPVGNAVGAVGATVAGLLFAFAGWGALVFVPVLALVGSRLVLGRSLPPPLSRFWVGSLLLLFAVASLPPLVHGLAPQDVAADAGGALGSALARIESTLLSRWGALVFSGLAGVLATLFLTGISTQAALGAVASAAHATGEAVWDRAHGALAGFVAAVGRASAALARLPASAGVWRERRARRSRVADLREEEVAPATTALAIPNSGTAPVAPAAAEPGEPAARRPRPGGPHIVDHDEERKKSSKPTQEAFLFDEGRTHTDYKRPDISLFQESPGTQRAYDRDSLIMNSRILEKKLRDFGVTGRVVTVHPGPVITMYEFEPASGVKVNRIVSLADDLALALRALSVRIIAPLPGKSVVGIEVPNPQREIVYIRDLLESPSFRNSTSRLTIALGKDIFGNPVEGDLAKMPHLLVAGATGTGKSVFLNTLLCSMLFRASPDELKLLMIDPKVLELSIYEGIPHLIADVVTNPKRAAAALGGIVHKMEDRYQMMAALGVRNIAQFNEKVKTLLDQGEKTFRLKAKPGEEEGTEVELHTIPYIVVVIDELADLMVVSARDVEEALQRLAQMARAAGIHLVLATQRPSVDVLTGVIKANFPSRISFQVSSRTDSRTILDQNGADHLLGQGDMLFLPPGTSKLQRLHGAFVSEKEVTELVAFLRDQGAPVFDETLTRMREESEKKEERGEDTDEMYDRAIELVAETRNASISYVQRRLKVGYNRAARMVEQMEQEGIIGPQEGTRPREVFVRPIGADLE